ncbi:MAG TPA: hypothetical protein P5219_00895 [Aminivibrio sp.]|uniref:hypothetical protein n=1 Tax=Aminivibrio sp. TaxID=1872489 RepID=UPI002BD8F508|nr:hypothetical protein [Aminivibrio sp.]HPF84318.1 hypothetical protein [Aminivibrio sp.]HRX25343.1 hypothetical protein [Aminivibrio sp.]
MRQDRKKKVKITKPRQKCRGLENPTFFGAWIQFFSNEEVLRKNKVDKVFTFLYPVLPFYRTKISFFPGGVNDCPPLITEKEKKRNIILNPLFLPVGFRSPSFCKKPLAKDIRGGDSLSARKA